MPSSLSLLAAIGAVAIAIAGASVLLVGLVCIATLVWEAVTVWAESSP